MNVALTGIESPQSGSSSTASVPDTVLTTSASEVAEPRPDETATSDASASEPEAVTAAGGSSPSAKPIYPYARPTRLPTQEGPLGLRFDFNDGCRVTLPQSAHPWKVCLSDLDTGNILYQTEIAGGVVKSSKRYYVRFRVEAWQQDRLVFSHDYSAADRDILIQLPTGTLGDTIGWFPYAVKFKEQHHCRLTCTMAEWLIPLFRGVYPEINFVTHKEVESERFYATYLIGLFFDDKDHVFQPCDFRYVGLHRTAGYILGVDQAETPPRIVLEDDSRPIPEPYVCIAVQSTTQAKYWNNPAGWLEITRFLKDAGYRVICIDRKPTHGHGIVWNQIPHGAEDETGDRPLLERARWLKHCDFFVGLSSGLSWLAWAMQTPVVMISGFTHPLNEFATPYRIVNYHACNSCWNDPHLRFDHKDFLWCPRHKDTQRQFECTRLITVEHVKSVIQTIPGFCTRTKPHAAGRKGSNRS